MDAIKVALIGVIFFFMNVDAEIHTNRHLFTRIMRVVQQNFSMYTLGSNTGIYNQGKCATHCKNEECFSFSYKVDNKRCDTYYRYISEEKDADVSISMSTIYFSKVLNNCSEVPEGSPSGVYKIETPPGNISNFFCDMDTPDGPWTVIQRRTQGDVDFYRNWRDYKDGFGDLQGDFWTGNDMIHLLTNTPRVLRVELQTWDGMSAYAQYSQFQVANEDHNYSLFVLGFSGNVSYDAMAYQNGQSFTTYDSDNDLYPYNCASHRDGAWWYKNCCKSNLNGHYEKDKGDNGESMFWHDLPPGRNRAPLKMSKMMIQ